MHAGRTPGNAGVVVADPTTFPVTALVVLPAAAVAVPACWAVVDTGGVVEAVTDADGTTGNGAPDEVPWPAHAGPAPPAPVSVPTVPGTAGAVGPTEAGGTVFKIGAVGSTETPGTVEAAGASGATVATGAGSTGVATGGAHPAGAPATGATGTAATAGMADPMVPVAAPGGVSMAGTGEGTATAPGIGVGYADNGGGHAGVWPTCMINSETPRVRPGSTAVDGPAV